MLFRVCRYFAILGVCVAMTFPACAGEFQDLGIPVVKAGLMGYLVGPDAEGRNTKLYFDFNQNGAPLFLVQVDPVTGEAHQFNAPSGNPGAWAFTVGPDERIYLGTWDGANILCFDPKAPDKGIQLIGKPAASETYIWDYTVGKDGKIYGCTYPQAKLVSYDPKTGAMKDLGRMDPQEQYARYVATGADGWIYTGIGMVRANIVAYNPQTGEHHGIIPESERHQCPFAVYNGVDGNAYGQIGKEYFRLLGGRGEKITAARMAGSAVHALPLQDGRKLVAADLQGHYTLENAAGAVTHHQFRYHGAGSRVFVVGVGPHGVVYGSSIMPLELFAYDPATGKLTNPGNPTSVAGEIYSLVPWHNELYVCAYPGSWMSRYDPDKPWHYGTKPENNPYGIGNLGDGHLRPRAMIIGPDEMLYVGSYPPYGQWGGAMGVFDPRTNKVVENYRNLIPDQAITALAYDPKSGLVFGGSSIAGGGGTTPKAKEAHFFVWDPVKKQKTLDIVPAPGGPTVLSMCIAQGKVFFVTNGSNSLHVFDIASRRVVHTETIPFGDAVDVSLQIRADGRIFGLTNKAVIEIDPQTYAIKEIAQSPVPITCGMALTDTAIYFGSGVHLWRYQLESGH